MTGRASRPPRELYYCRIALEVAARGTCLRRNFGAVLANSDLTEIVSTGYTGAPRKMQNCTDRGSCLRRKRRIPQGRNYELCRSVHAEMNALLHASRREMIGGNLFLAGISATSGRLVRNAQPCKLCKRMIINAGLTRVFVLVEPDRYRCFDVAKDWIAHEHEVFEVESKSGY